MAMTAKELRDWLENLHDDELIGIDDGGLTLVVVDDPSGSYLEVGGVPDGDDYMELADYVFGDGE